MSVAATKAPPHPNARHRLTLTFRCAVRCRNVDRQYSTAVKFIRLYPIELVVIERQLCVAVRIAFGGETAPRVPWLRTHAGVAWPLQPGG
jgi:hypothetical protein